MIACFVLVLVVEPCRYYITNKIGNHIEGGEIRLAGGERMETKRSSKQRSSLLPNRTAFISLIAERYKGSVSEVKRYRNLWISKFPLPGSLRAASALPARCRRIFARVFLCTGMGLGDMYLHHSHTVWPLFPFSL